MTKHEKEIGYELCQECDTGVHLLEAGFEVTTRKCQQCNCFVADTYEFFDVNLDVQILSK